MPKSNFSSGLDFLGNTQESNQEQKVIKEELKAAPIPEIKEEKGTLFNISKFIEELEDYSEDRNSKRADRPGNITGYDIAHNCIRQVIYKLRNTPLESYADLWLPIYMRSSLGSAVHNFIQERTSQISEIETAVKVPSLGFYGVIDGLIGNNILVEIKSCPYNDYSKIIKNKKPRQKDYLQTMTYRYMLENHLEEIKHKDTKLRFGTKPVLNNYNIEHIQFIYIAHDLISSDMDSFSKNVQSIRDLKKKLNSKNNPFFFITSLNLEVDDKSKKECDTWIENKITSINECMRNNILPAEDNPFVIKDCFFCPYQKICDIR